MLFSPVAIVSPDGPADFDLSAGDYNFRMNRADIHRFLAGCRLGVLGTIGENGQPQSSLVAVAASDELDLIFDTVKRSRKYSNLRARPRCSFAIGWDGEQTVQFEGVAEELTAGLVERYRPVYFRKFPDAPERLSWDGIVYFVVHPIWIRYSDFDARPPLIEEFRFGELAAGACEKGAV